MSTDTKDRVLEAGEAEARIARLAEDGADEETFLAEVRKLPGAEGRTDEQLLALWNAARGEATEPEEKPEPPPALPVTLYDEDGNVVENPSELTLAELSRLQVGYQANGKEQRQPLEKLVRLAANTEGWAKRAERLRSERQQLYEQWKAQEAEIERAKREREVWETALRNPEYYKRLQQEYQNRLNRPPQTGDVPEGYVPEDQVQRQLEAQRYVLTEVKNATDQLAQRYGADPTELFHAATQLIGSEPPELVTTDRVGEILAEDLPMALEEAGYSPSAEAPAEPAEPPATPAEPAGEEPAEVQALKEQIQELKAQIGNTQTDAARQRSQSVPTDTGGSGSAPDQPVVPKFKTADDYRAALEDPNETFGL